MKLSNTRINLQAHCKIILLSRVLLFGIIMTTASYLLFFRGADSEQVAVTSDVPTYATVTPNGATIESLGGWKRVSPPEKDPVYSYNDLLDDVQISVTEQPLPKSFTADAAASTADIATSFNATNKIDADGISVYLGSSAKGPQSVIFTKDRLLFLIKSEKKINDDTWRDYISSFQ